MSKRSIEELLRELRSNRVVLSARLAAEAAETIESLLADNYRYRAKLIRVVDGDTVSIEVDLGLDIFTKLSCRLARINAPEMNTDAGKAAKEYLAGILAADQTFWVRTLKDRQEKYGRYLIEIESSHGNVNDLMLQAGMAKEYGK